MRFMEFRGGRYPVVGVQQLRRLMKSPAGRFEGGGKDRPAVWKKINMKPNGIIINLWTARTEVGPCGF